MNSLTKKKGMYLTDFAKSVKQPELGYLPIDSFEQKAHRFDIERPEEINLKSFIIKLVVSYLSERALLKNLAEAFKIPMRGAFIVGKGDHAKELLKTINKRGDKAISAAFELVSYEIAYRAGVSNFNKYEHIVPTQQEIEYVRRLLIRTERAFKPRLPMYSNVTFENGYTDIITSGDARFISYKKDTLWDISVSEGKPSSVETLKLLLAHILFKNAHNGYVLKRIGIFNPVTNISYTYDIAKMDSALYRSIEDLAGIPPENEMMLINFSVIDKASKNVKEHFRIHVNGFDSLTTEIAEGRLDPDTLWFKLVTVVKDKVTKKACLLGDCEVSYDGKGTWVIDEKDFFNLDHFIETLREKGFAESKIRETMTRINYYKTEYLK